MKWFGGCFVSVPQNINRLLCCDYSYFRKSSFLHMRCVLQVNTGSSLIVIGLFRTPLHCAASCNNTAIAQLLVRNGACVFAMTISDRQTPSEKCEPDEDDYEACLHFLQGKPSTCTSTQKASWTLHNYDRC